MILTWNRMVRNVTEYKGMPLTRFTAIAVCSWNFIRAWLDAYNFKATSSIGYRPKAFKLCQEPRL